MLKDKDIYMETLFFSYTVRKEKKNHALIKHNYDIKNMFLCICIYFHNYKIKHWNFDILSYNFKTKSHNYDIIQNHEIKTY